MSSSPESPPNPPAAGNPIIVESVSDVLDILSVLAFTYFGGDFVALLRHHLCVSGAAGHSADMRRDVQGVLLPSVSVNEEFIDAAYVALGCCEELLCLGSAEIDEDIIRYLMEVLRRTIVVAEKSTAGSYFPRLYLDEIFFRADEKPAATSASAANTSSASVNLPPVRGSVTARARARPAQQQQQHPAPAPVPAPAAKPLPAPAPARRPIYRARTRRGLACSTMVPASSRSSSRTSNAALRPTPLNGAPALPSRSVQTLQQFHNQTVNNYNRGRGRTALVWLPVRFGGWGITAEQGSWSWGAAGDWEAMVGEVGGWEGWRDGDCWDGKVGG